MKLKPYVSVHTPQVEKKLIEEIKKLNDFTQPENFGRFVGETSLEKAARLQIEERLEVSKTKKEEKKKIQQMKS